MNTRLDDDVYALLCKHLPTQTIINFASSSKFHYNLFAIPSIWKTMGQKDFFVNLDQVASPEVEYKKIKSELDKERERFAKYITAFRFITKDQEQVANSTSLKSHNREYVTNLIKHKIDENYIKTEQRINERLNALDNAVMKSENAFVDYFQELSKEMDSDSLNQTMRANKALHTLCMGVRLFRIAQIENMTDEESKNILDLLFTILCKLDAHHSINILLHRNNLFKKNDLLIHAFQYPCKKVITTLLNYNIALNEKAWIIDEYDSSIRMHTTPLMMAIYAVMKWRQYELQNDIISLLMTKDIDINTPVFVTEDDWDTDEQYQSQCLPILKYLEDYMAEVKEGGDKDPRYTNIVKRVLDSVEQKATLSKCSTSLKP